MNILIFGATGGTGQQLVAQSLARGNKTSVFIHNKPLKLAKYADKITSFQGDVLDFNAVNQAVKGQDAVLVALGVIPGKSKNILSIGTSNIIRSMDINGAKRLIVETGAGLVEDRSQIPLLWKLMSKIPPMRDMFDDKKRQENVIKTSKLEWIIVRPTNLTNRPLTSSYDVGEHFKLKNSSTISRADVANFMIKQIESSEWVRKAVILKSIKT